MFNFPYSAFWTKFLHKRNRPYFQNEKQNIFFVSILLEPQKIESVD